MIKQAFKFLNTLCLFPENKGVFMAGHPYQISGAIIMLDAIEMVDMPPFWQWFAMCFLPYQKVFSNISIAIRPRMVRHSYKHISTNNNATTTPIVASNPPVEWGLIAAASAPSRSWGNCCPTIQARMSSSRIVSLPHFLVRLIIYLPISFLLHSYIITHSIITIKEYMMGRIYQNNSLLVSVNYRYTRRRNLPSQQDTGVKGLRPFRYIGGE